MIFGKGGGRRGVALAVSAGCAALALLLFVIWGSLQVHAPQPTAANNIPRTAHSQTTAPASSASPAPAALPTALSIPVIGVSHSLATVGLNPDGSLQVPSLSDVAVPAWYTGSPRPGDPGPAVIVGHVDSAASGKGVFFDLGDLHIGDQIIISRADGTTVTFLVTNIESVPKATFPTQAVYGNTPDAELRVITCGGAFDTATGHYLNNIIVFARLGV